MPFPSSNLLDSASPPSLAGDDTGTQFAMDPFGILRGCSSISLGNHTMRPTISNKNRAPRAWRTLLLLLMICPVICLSGPRGAEAQARFGDSTWVAPGALFDNDSTAADGPRVAPRDHERGWETALRTPFRVVFFPLRLLAAGSEAGVGHFGPRFLDPKAPHAPKRGLSVGPSIAMGTGTDIRLGPAFTWKGVPTANTQLRATATLSLQDHRHVKFRESLLSPRPVSLRVAADYDYKPTRRFYGLGNDALKTNLGYYLLESTTGEAALAFGKSPLRQVRAVVGYSSMSPRRGYNRTPLLEEVFPLSSVPYSRVGTDEVLYGVTADLASLNDVLDPSIGAHGHIEMRRVVGVRSIDPDYSQWWVEGRTYVPVFAKYRVLALRGVYTGVKPRGGATTTLPFYRLPQSEGSTHFAGYNSGRFRDRQLILARAEYRWPIVRRLNALALFEMGEVAPNSSSFRLRSTHNSYGGGFRLGLSDESAFRLEMAQSVEGFHMVLELGSTF